MPMIAGVALLLCGVMMIEVPAPSGNEDAAEVLTSVRNRIRGLSASEKDGGVIGCRGDRPSLAALRT